MQIFPLARCAFVLVLATGTSAAWSQALIYKSVNPTFGGDSFNSSHLLGVAGAQNSYKEKGEASVDRSQADLFASQLQSRLLSALAGQVTEVKARASLVGDHLMQANYAPEMRFELGADRDFLAPLKIAQQKDAAGAMRISWQGVDRSRAYFLSVMGQARDGAAVIWTSSAVPLSSFSMAGYLDRAELTRLLALKALLPADARQCTIPAAVMREIETPLLQMNALGEEATIAQPRPATAPATWRPAWSVMLRYRSDTMAMLGQPMPSLGATGGEEEPAVESDKAPQRAKKRRGGLLGAAAGWECQEFRVRAGG